MQNIKTAYIILLLLTLLVLAIYLYQNCNYTINRFTDISSLTNTTANTNISHLINLPDNDIHFISDNNSKLITTSLYNYKLDITTTILTATTPMTTASNTPIATLNATIATPITMDKTISSTVKYISVFMHQNYQYNNTNYTPLGQYIKVSDTPIDINNSNIMADILTKKCLNYVSSSPYYPVDYNLIWTSDINKDGNIFSVWRPIPPSGFVAMGDIIVSGITKPAPQMITCIPITMLEHTGISNGILWHSINDMGKNGYCWGAGNIDTFMVSNSYSKDIPELLNVYNLTPQTIQNNTLNDNTQPTRQTNGISI